MRIWPGYPSVYTLLIKSALLEKNSALIWNAGPLSGIPTSSHTILPFKAFVPDFVIYYWVLWHFFTFVSLVRSILSFINLDLVKVPFPLESLPWPLLPPPDGHRIFTILHTALFHASIPLYGNCFLSFHPSSKWQLVPLACGQALFLSFLPLLCLLSLWSAVVHLILTCMFGETWRKSEAD